MKKPQFLIGVAGLTLGLLLGGMFLGRANAQQQGPRYQYMCQTKMDRRYWSPEVQAKLNELGGQGWQLLDTSTRNLGQGTNPNSDVYCFERRY